jgi:hypothetical protein
MSIHLVKRPSKLRLAMEGAVRMCAAPADTHYGIRQSSVRNINRKHKS